MGQRISASYDWHIFHLREVREMFEHEDLGKTKLDHVLSYISYALRDACVLGVSAVFIYWAIYWINQLISNWIYRAL